MIGVEGHVVITRGGQEPAAPARLKRRAGHAEGTNSYLALFPIEAAEFGAQGLVTVKKNGNKHELFMQLAASQ
jgi:hypothetical protein